MAAKRFTTQMAHFLGIFIVAAAVLSYQVLLTRLFSVVLYYHFAYAGISLVMLGLTIGAVEVYLHPARFAPALLAREWATNAIGFSISSVAAALWFIYCPIILPQNAVFLIVDASIFLFVIPFMYSGICVTLILTASPFSVGRLYAADLVGAALGCVGVVGLLSFVDPIAIIFAIAALVACAAAFMAPPGALVSVVAKGLTLTWCLAFLLQGGLYMTGEPHLRLLWAKDKPQEHLLFERWNALARVRVLPTRFYGPTKDGHPFGWGFGHPQNQPSDQNVLDIDADAATVITRFDGRDLKPFGYLSNDVINMGYHIRAIQSAAVVGVGGGRDILSALYFGVQHVTGIELNGAIFEALTKRFGEYSGHLDQRADVSLVNAEARSWLNHSQSQFDLIQISLIDTWAATAAGGLTMSENKLYTLDAWKEFLARLTPNGMLVVSRWFDAQTYRPEFYRLLSLAAETLRARGVPNAEIRSHIIAVNANDIVTVAVSIDPFSQADLARARAAATHEGFRILIDPQTSWDTVSGTIASGNANDEFYASLASNVTAPTDNRPFFFYTWKPFRGSFSSSGETLYGRASYNQAVMMMCLLLGGTLLSTGAFVFWPLWRNARQTQIRPLLPYLGYFTGIGVAFMLIEISQMQRLIVFLGHPIYGLTVVLFTLLLCGGMGSFTVKPESLGRIWVRPALVCAVLCLIGVLTPIATQAMQQTELLVRVLVSIALLAPAGFCMGMMFPTGMLLSREFRAQQAWFWGVNGAASVFASVLGMAISTEFGITQAFWSGVVCYGACLLMVLLVGAKIRQVAFLKAAT